MINQKLRSKLLAMAAKDQAMRKHAINNSADWDPAIDKANTAELKKIIAQFGWPDTCLVGKRGATAAWLIVQHADLDPVFQRRCLGLLQLAAKHNRASVELIAYLTDRVLLNEGKKQLYGTQFRRLKNGRMIPRPIKDRQALAARRRAMGLQPFADYERLMKAKHEKRSRG